MSIQLDIKLPNSWAELTPDQLRYVSRLIFYKMPEVEILSRCFFMFTGIKILNRDPEFVITRDEPDGEQVYWMRRKDKGKFSMGVDLASTLIHHLDFLLDEITLFKNPEKIKGFKGCSHRLYDLSLEEWILLDQFYIAYAKTEKIEFLNKMLAITYTSEGEKYDESVSLDKRAKRFKRVKEADKYTVFLWYTGVKLWLKNQYYYLFDSSGGDGATSPADYVLGLLSSLNDGNVALNPQLKKTACHEVFHELNRRIEKSKTSM